MKKDIILLLILTLGNYYCLSAQNIVGKYKVNYILGPKKKQITASEKEILFEQLMKLAYEEFRKTSGENLSKLDSVYCNSMFEQATASMRQVFSMSLYLDSNKTFI